MPIKNVLFPKKKCTDSFVSFWKNIGFPKKNPSLTFTTFNPEFENVRFEANFD
jgi:hypothetical protein